MTERGIYALLWLLGALLSGVAIWWGINPHDEGLVLQAAVRIGDGQLPYRDFYANYGPAQYYLIGGLDWLFGPSLLSWRILRVVLDATVGVLAYALVRREGGERPPALLAWLAAVAAMAYPSLPHPNATALALGLGALLLAPRAPAGAGALAGLAFVFRFDLGLAAALGAVLLALARGERGAALRCAAGAALVAALLMAPFVLSAADELWDQTVGFALDEQSLQRLPLPGAWEGGFEPSALLHFYFPYVLLGGLALWLGLALATRAPLRLWVALPLALAGLAYLLARADEFHQAPLAVALAVLLGSAVARERESQRRAAALALVAVLALIALHGLDRKRVAVFSPPPLATLALPPADGVKAPTEEARALERLAAFVGDRVPARRAAVRGQPAP